MVKFGGVALSAWRLGLAYSDWNANPSWAKVGRYAPELTFDAVGMLGPYGFLFSTVLRVAWDDRAMRQIEMQGVLDRGEDLGLYLWLRANQDATMYGK